MIEPSVFLATHFTRFYPYSLRALHKFLTPGLLAPCIHSLRTFAQTRTTMHENIECIVCCPSKNFIHMIRSILWTSKLRNTKHIMLLHDLRGRPRGPFFVQAAGLSLQDQGRFTTGARDYYVHYASADPDDVSLYIMDAEENRLLQVHAAPVLLDAGFFDGQVRQSRQ